MRSRNLQFAYRLLGAVATCPRLTPHARASSEDGVSLRGAEVLGVPDAAEAPTSPTYPRQAASAALPGP